VFLRLSRQKLDLRAKLSGRSHPLLPVGCLVAENCSDPTGWPVNSSPRRNDPRV
jgi:hypothetical protein